MNRWYESVVNRGNY